MAQAKPPDNVIHPEFNVLMHAIATCAGPAIQKLLLENPSLVQIKGWHGMTTLHRACLGGDYNVIHLLLRAGADPNVMNNNTETATHFCCKRGNPSVLHLMIEFGGDINIVDRQGRGAILHAAESGSVSMIHYLNTVCNLSLDVMDSKLQTPFHVLCVYGHMDAIKYFMKKNRCDLMKANLDGDTPLHILGREGHSHLCWLILATAGCSSLHVVNNAGFTPKDLAEQRDKMGHREINPVFEYYYKQSNRNLRPRGPVLIWYWLLLMPTVIYGSSVIVANFIGPIFHGTVIVVGLVFILYTQKKQLHRMQHVCRWPNPIYAGVFGAGIFHTFIVYYVLLLPYISRWTVLLCLTPLITALVLYLYWKVLTVDPGAVKRSCYEESLKRELTLRDLCLPTKKVTDFCVDCELSLSVVCARVI